MTDCRRGGVVVIASLLLAVSAGCGDFGAMAYFLLPEQRIEPRMRHLASADAKKDSRVVILTWSAMETRTEFIHADRQLSELLGQQLQQLAEQAKERISIVPARKVEEYKNAHPDWRSLDLTDIGRHFDADYVIYLEIHSMSLYEVGGTQLLRGRANLTVSLADVRKPDDAPLSQPYTCIYPSESPGPVPVGDMHPMQFRQKFLTHMAKQLAQYFSRYPRSERFQME